MKILYIFSHSFTDMPYHVREWVEAAVELGHEVIVLTSIDPAFLESVGWTGKISVLQADIPRTKIKGVWHYLSMRNFIVKLEECLKDFRPDAIYERMSFLSPATAKVAQKAAIPYGLEVNGILEDELKLCGAGPFRLFLARRTQAAAYRRAGHVITVTWKIRDWILRRYGIAEEKVLAVPNGVNPERFRPMDKKASRKKFDIPENAFVLGYLGSLFPWQDFDIILDTAEELRRMIPNIYYMIGGGQEPLFSQIKKTIDARHLDDIFFMPGQIPWDDAAEFISCFDAGLLTLKGNIEGSPQKLASYMACGRPAIGVSSPGVEDILVSGDTGFIYGQGDRASFVAEAVKMSSLTEDKRLAMGERARQAIIRNYSWRAVVSKIIGFISADRNVQ